ncbi:MAG TPA: ATP-binding cassette domain-containing protein [Methanocella sp.]|nr:ATP-binding cassette domain-containing protein [Methanocella sp.]
MADYAIEVRNLTKKFGDFTAVDNITFNVNDGEIFGFLGPNGAGKSTTIRILCTLARPTSGSAKIAGFDLLKDSAEVRKKIGLVSEKMIMYEQLTARENLRYFGRLHKMPKTHMERRIDDLLALVNMTEWGNTQVKKFSTGMRQRINVIRALLPKPGIVFMDEPTLGLDPQTTLSIRDIIKDLNKNGTTVILTTHAMVEAEALSDRVAIIDHGKIAALDSPQSLKHLVSKGDGKLFTVRIPNLTPALADKIKSLDCIAGIAQEDAYELKISAKESNAIETIVGTIAGAGGRIETINTLEPSLEDVFLTVTGKEMRDEASNKNIKPMFHDHGEAPKARVR